MAQIPVSESRGLIAESNLNPAPRVSNEGAQAIARAGERLGDAGMQLAHQALLQKRQEDEQLSRARATNLALDHDLQVKQVVDRLDQSLADGSLDYREADTAYQNAISQLDPPDISAFDAPIQEQLRGGMKRTVDSGLAQLQSGIDRARKQDFKSQTDAALDTIGKKAGLPGSNVAGEVSSLSGLDGIGRIAYGEQWNAVKQTASDRIWTAQAQNRALDTRDNMDGLKQLENDLTAADGYYADKLDGDKRKELRAQVAAYQDRLTSKNQANADRLDARALRVLGQMDQYAAIGLDPPPELVTSWGQQVRGSTLKSEFDDRMKTMGEVRKVRQLPPQQQVAWLQDQERKLATDGGRLSEVTALQAARKTIMSGLQTLQDDPLVYQQNQTGVAVTPADFTMAATPQGQQQLRAMFEQREENVGIVRKQYGASVRNNVLLPAEINAVQSMLANTTPTQQLQTVAMLRNVLGDKAYEEAMRRVLPDDPVMMAAGLAAGKDMRTSDGAQVANLIADGKAMMIDKTQKIPADETKNGVPGFERVFSDAVGNAIAPGTKARNAAFAAAKAAYLSMARTRGESMDRVNPKLMQDAVSAVIGPVVEYNGQKVVIPYGMRGGPFGGTFGDAVKTGIADLSQRTGLNADRLANLPLYRVGDGQYYLMSGADFVRDEQGAPYVVNVQ